MSIAGHLPDITSAKTQSTFPALSWVGMEKVAVPLRLAVDSEQTVPVSALANIYVSLDDTSAKGIHMSRIYALANELATDLLSKEVCDELLEKMVQSQGAISQSARVELAFDLVLAKGSLLSGKSGYQSYEIEIHGESVEGRRNYGLKVTIPYSSTCPCSAALTRQLFAEALDNEFPDAQVSKQELLSWVQEKTVATPHSQRSYAYLELDLGDRSWPDLASFVTAAETAIGTPVQTLVKREDEQEFARLNGENLMFCEDAARRLKSYLATCDWLEGYKFKVEHQESLHAHNAVAVDFGN